MSRLKPEDVTAVVDSREQKPLDLAPLQIVTGTLSTGDYSVRGLEDHIAVERKSLPDLITCVGRERERFERELDRLRAYSVRALVIESSWQEIEAGQWRGKITPRQIEASLARWLSNGIPFSLCGTHERAGRFVSRLLYLTARREYERLTRLTGASLEVTK